MEIIAAILFFSRFVLAATAVSLCIMLFRHYRHIGWLVLGSSFLSPFLFLLLRLCQSRPLLTYRSSGPIVVGGATQLNFRLEFPVFYLVVVIALFLLIREVRCGKKAS
jgi:hypothetical protein